MTDAQFHELLHHLDAIWMAIVFVGVALYIAIAIHGITRK
jgi:hypothetical protein